MKKYLVIFAITVLTHFAFCDENTKGFDKFQILQKNNHYKQEHNSIHSLSNDHASRRINNYQKYHKSQTETENHFLRRVRQDETQDHQRHHRRRHKKQAYLSHRQQNYYGGQQYQNQQRDHDYMNNNLNNLGTGIEYGKNNDNNRYNNNPYVYSPSSNPQQNLNVFSQDFNLDRQRAENRAHRKYIDIADNWEKIPFILQTYK